MSYVKKDFSPPVNNKVIAYTDGMAILKLPDDPGKLYFERIRQEYVTIGEHLVDADPKPISLLPPELRQKIIVMVLGGM